MFRTSRFATRCMRCGWSIFGPACCAPANFSMTRPSTDIRSHAMPSYSVVGAKCTTATFPTTETEMLALAFGFSGLLAGGTVAVTLSPTFRMSVLDLKQGMHSMNQILQRRTLGRFVMAGLLLVGAAVTFVKPAHVPLMSRRTRWSNAFRQTCLKPSKATNLSRPAT